jgi:hypothetical protein
VYNIRFEIKAIPNAKTAFVEAEHNIDIPVLA